MKPYINPEKDYNKLIDFMFKSNLINNGAFIYELFSYNNYLIIKNKYLFIGLVHAISLACYLFHIDGIGIELVQFAGKLVELLL